MSGTEKMTIYISAAARKQLEGLCHHYRWKLGHTVTELLLFYLRSQKYGKRFMMGPLLEGPRKLSDGHSEIDGAIMAVLDKGGEIEDVYDLETVDEDFRHCVRELQKGLLGAFQEENGILED